MGSPRLLPVSATSKSWRVLSLSSALTTPWTVQRIRFFQDEACTSDVTAKATVSASGSASDEQGPQNALTASASVWNSACGQSCCGAWLGVDFAEPQQVRCVLVDLPAGSSRPPLALQLYDGAWKHVATVPPEGGVADIWAPLAMGAVCQGVGLLAPDIRADGQLWILNPYALHREHVKISEMHYFSDDECTDEVTQLGVPLEGFFWGGRWQPGRTPSIVTDAFDNKASTTWEGAMHDSFWTGFNGEQILSFGMMLPEGVDVKCLRVAQEGFTHRWRFLQCGGPQQWVGVDNCVCAASWSTPSLGPLVVGPPERQYTSTIVMLLITCAFILATCSWPLIEKAAQRLQLWLWAMMRQMKVGKGKLDDSDDGDRAPLVSRDAAGQVSQLAPSSFIESAHLGHVEDMHKQFRHQARHHHYAGSENRLALRTVCGDLSYQQLAALVDPVLTELRRCLQPRSVVGFILDRGPCFVVAMLAVLEADCVWVPIDDRAPNDRNKSLLEDAGACLVLVAEKATWDLGIATVRMSLDGRLLGTMSPQQKPPGPVQEADTACLYFTSGSTGAPKAVVMDQRFFVVNAKWYVDCFNVTLTSVVAAKASFIWATALWEILPPLICGAGCQLLPTLKTEEIKGALALGGITHFCGVPSELELIIEPELKLQHIICMGEKLLPVIAERLHARIPRGCSLWNAYAATESAVILWKFRPGSTTVFAGQPLQGSFVAVLAEDGSLAPPGEIGEVVLGGVMPRCGYWQRPDLVAERFGESSVGFVYRTGDLGRIVRDIAGDLQTEITGRKDRMVKIRGQRVELGEVEACAAQLVAGTGHVAVVSANSEDGQAHMFLFGSPADMIDAKELRGEMKKKLPEYMLPDADRMRLLPELPRLPNGKINFSELKSTAANLLASEEHTALDSLGLARKYSQDQLSFKHAIDVSSGWFLMGMLLFHAGWWTWGTDPLGCVDCTPRYIIKFLLAAVVNETCLFGFVCGAGLMATTQADCFVFTSRDTATLIIYLFMYLPWNFILSEVVKPFPMVFMGGEGGTYQYNRWFLMMMLQAKVLVVVTKRTGLWPVVIVAALIAAFVYFPASGIIEVGIVGTCQRPGSVFSFFACWLLPFVGNVRLMERKFISPMLVYYASVMYGPPFAKFCGRFIVRPASSMPRACYALAFGGCAAAAGYWYLDMLYPAGGYETVEWPDGLEAVANPRINSKQSVIMLTLGIGVPLLQVVLLFAAVYFAPGDGMKQVLASWIQPTMLGTYLITANLNFASWVLEVVMFVCDCQCTALQGWTQLLGVMVVLITVTLTFGMLFQAFLLRLVVPGTFWAFGALRAWVERATSGSDETGHSTESSSTE